jgi:hypothetical protein
MTLLFELGNNYTQITSYLGDIMDSVFRYTRIKKIMTNDQWAFLLQKEYSIIFLLGDFLKYSNEAKAATTYWSYTMLVNSGYKNKFKISNNFLLETNMHSHDEYDKFFLKILSTESIFFNIL